MLVWMVMGMATADRELTLQPGAPDIGRGEALELWQTIPDVDMAKPSVTLTPSEAYHWIAEPGQTLTLNLAVPAEAGCETALLTVWDWERHPVAQETFALPCAQAIEFSCMARGTWLLTLDLFSGGKCVARLARGVSWCPSNEALRRIWDEGPFFVGICAFPERLHWANDFGDAVPEEMTEQQTRDFEMELNARAGIQVMRQTLFASPMWWDGSKPIDFAMTDTCVESLKKHDIKPFFQFLGIAPWMLPAANRDKKGIYLPEEAPWREYARQCVERYAEDAFAFEVQNETDNYDFWLGTPEEYVDIYRWTWEELKRVAPEVPVTNAGYTFILPHETGVIARGVQGKVDWVAYHSHGGMNTYTPMWAAMRGVHAAAGYEAPKYVNTEMGYCAWRLDFERDMAATAVQKLVFCWAHGHRGALLYESRSITAPRTFGDWGYLDYYFSPRAMYGAISAFVDQFAGAKFERILAETADLHVFQFQRGPARLVTFYTPDLAERQITLTADAEKAFLIDPMGNSTPLEGGAQLELKADLYPRTVLLAGATSEGIKLSEEPK